MVLAFCVFAPDLGHANTSRQLSPTLLSGTTAVTDLHTSMRLFEDTSAKADLNDIIQRYKRREGDVSQTGLIHLEYKPHTNYWLLFSVFNRDKFNQKWILNFGDVFDGTLGIASRVEIYDTENPNTPFVIDGAKAYNKVQIEKQLKNMLPIETPAEKVKIYAVKIQLDVGQSVKFKPELLTFVGQSILTESREKQSMGVLLIIAMFLLSSVLIATFTRRATPYLFIPYIALYYMAFISQDTIIAFGNNTSVILAPLIYNSIIGIGILITAVIGLDKNRNFLKILSILMIIPVLITGWYCCYTVDSSEDLYTFTRLTLPALLMGYQTLLALYLLFRSPIQKSSLILLFSTMLFIMSMGLILYRPPLFIDNNILFLSGTSMLHVAAFLAFAFFKLNQLNQKEAFEAVQENERTLQNKEEHKKQVSADQNKLVNILQRERELIQELKDREGERAEAMRKAKDIADDANHAKSSFLAVISHEIRTPMTGIMGMIRLLLDSQLDEKQTEYAQTVQYSGDALLALLNDILDFSKIEEGRMEIENVDFDLKRMIDSVVMLMSGRAKENNIKLTAELGSDLPEFLKGDPSRLRQILLNLIGNAVKFTERGGVKIIVNREGGTDESPLIRFSVKDTGIGISAEAQKNLFNPFSQADSSISRRFGGTGLGLAICKRLVSAMGSDIQIESSEGQGSTFHFALTMPQGQPTGEGHNDYSAIDIPELKILVADDNNINQKVLIGILSKDGHHVTAVNNGQEAIDALHQNSFDVVLMDMQMPVMNGIDARIRIRKMESPKRANVPIIAMTANVMKEDIQKCRDVGMNEHMSKPINPDTLRSLIARVAIQDSDYKPARRTKDKVVSQINTSSAPEQMSEVRPPVAPITTTPDAPPQPTATPIPSTVANVQVVTAETSVSGSTVIDPPSSAKASFDHVMLQDLKTSLGAKDLSEMLIDLFKKSEELITDIEEGYKTQDHERLRNRGHDLYGMTANFGLTALSEPARRIELDARDKKSFDVIKADVSGLRDAYQNMRAELNTWLAV